MCPLILELKKHEDVDCKVCLTGQHREMLQQVMEAFKVETDYNLDIMRQQQTLTTITTSVIEKLEPILETECPDIVLVHGDTTTSYAASIAAFYKKIPIGHVEAGLRTGNIYSPFPEEMNRVMISRIATFHFAPTEQNKKNLYLENIKSNVYITGNTVIDSFKTTVSSQYVYQKDELNHICYEKTKVILVTAHRRENLGEPLENICRAIKRLVEARQDVLVIYPVHMNPQVRNTVYSILGDMEQVKLMEPLNVLDMHNLMSRCYMVMTDSGGLQEEAPAFGKPVLVLRTETERPEAVEAGTVKVVGIDEEDIFSCAKDLIENITLYSQMAHAVNPYGDGCACQRIVNIIKREFTESRV